MARKLGKAQTEAVGEMLAMLPGDQYRVTVTGPRESDRALLVNVQRGERRAERSEWYLVGFGGLITVPDMEDGWPDPREFYPHG